MSFDGFMAIVKCHCFLVSALINSRVPLKMTVSQQIPKQYITSPNSALLHVLSFFTATGGQKVTTYIGGTENTFRGVGDT